MYISRMKAECCRVVLLYDGPLLPTKEGASQRVLMTARSLAQRGYPTTVLLAYRGWSDWRLLAHEPFATILLHPEEYYAPSPLLAQLLNQLAPSWLQTKDPEVLATYSLANGLLPPTTRFLFECHDMHAVPSLVERWALEVSDQVVCLSDADVQQAKAYMTDSTRAFAIPCFLSETTIIPRIHRGSGSRIAFLGNFYYEPNAEAIVWISEHLLPLLLVKHPGIQLHIFGDAPLSLQQAHRRDEIIWHGPLHCLHQALATCDIALSVVFHGTGFRVKLLDYCAAGLPIVANQLGIAGIGNHSCFYIAETAEVLAEQCLTLLGSASLRQQHAVQTQSLIRQHFSSEAVGPIYDSFLLSVPQNELTSARLLRSKLFFQRLGQGDGGQHITQWAHNKPAWLQEFIHKQRFPYLEDRLVSPGTSFHLHYQQDRENLEQQSALLQATKGNNL